MSTWYSIQWYDQVPFYILSPVTSGPMLSTISGYIRPHFIYYIRLHQVPLYLLSQVTPDTILYTMSGYIRPHFIYYLSLHQVPILSTISGYIRPHFIYYPRFHQVPLYLLSQVTPDTILSTISSHIRTFSSNEGRRFLCNVFSHWLRPFSCDQR